MYTIILTLVLGGVVGFLCSRKESLFGKITSILIGAAVSGILIGGCITGACANYAKPVLEKEVELVSIKENFLANWDETFYLIRVPAENSTGEYIVYLPKKNENGSISIRPSMAPGSKSEIHEFEPGTEVPKMQVWKTHSKWVDNRTLYKFYVPKWTILREELIIMLK
jgi:hypothetical protein